MKKTLLEVKSLTKLPLLSLSTNSMMVLRDFPEGEAVVPVAVEPVASWEKPRSALQKNEKDNYDWNKKSPTGDLFSPSFYVITLWEFSYLFLDFALKNVRQGAYWVTSYGFQLPWAGIDKEGCKYMSGNCTDTIRTADQKFSYPIDIKTVYPPVINK